jgi:hypothetical protein
MTEAFREAWWDCEVNERFDSTDGRPSKLWLWLLLKLSCFSAGRGPLKFEPDVLRLVDR